jgi:hypothetical protein
MTNNLNKLKPEHIAWLLPPAYLIHLFDEYFFGFTGWFSAYLKASLSTYDFIVINVFGLTAAILIVFLFSLGKLNIFFIAALGSLFFINGLIHLAASTLTATYSPGTISGVVVYLPLGYLIFKKLFPLLPPQHRKMAVTAGVIIQIIVTVIAVTI